MIDVVEEHIVDVDGTRICFAVEGASTAPAILLIAGLGQDLYSWPRSVVEGLRERGLRVVRMDNRDSGRSERIRRPAPGTVRQLLGRPLPGAYSLSDMAADTVGVLDHLGIRRVHVVGMSLGGMIAQTLAAEYPSRVSSLVSLFSTTGAPGVGGAAWSTKMRLARPPARDVDSFIARHLEMTRHLRGRRYAPSVSWETNWARLAWERSPETPTARADAQARQIQAIQASGDRTDALRRIVAPTLVVHGDRDRIVHPSGGHATHAAIAASRHVTIAGMGHHLAPGLLDTLVDLISPAGHAAASHRTVAPTHDLTPPEHETNLEMPNR